MPFTLAHPAFILPLARCRFLHFPALVLGAMSPDFAYFLYGKPVNCGHGWKDIFWLDVPLTALFWLFYRRLLAEVLHENLPDCLNAAYPPTPRFKRSWQHVLCFTLSAALGAFSHIVLDAFTHGNGGFVLHFEVLRQPVGGLALFKWLQYGGGIGGLAALLWYQCRMARRFPAVSHKNGRQKWQFWLRIGASVCALLLAWQLIVPIAAKAAAIWVIRLVDACILALAFAGLWKNSLKILCKPDRQTD